MAQERCARCGEVDEDRRTVWMACFYAMDELDVPFDVNGIKGVGVPLTGYQKLSSFNVSVPQWGDPDPGEEPRVLQFYTLRVCKGCRGSWMAAIESWFKSAELPRESPGTGIFVRENGATIEITEAEWEARCRENGMPGQGPVRLKSKSPNGVPHVESGGETCE